MSASKARLYLTGHALAFVAATFSATAPALAGNYSRLAEQGSPSAQGTPPVQELLYLNRCTPTCTVLPGPDNAITNQSSLVNQPRVIPEHAFGDASWGALVKCVRRVYAPYFMTITETDPGNVPHRELMIGGNPGNIGMSSGVLGVSPWACGDPLVNTIAFVFSAAHGDNIPELCWTATHEAGHLFGLDHEFHQPDSMSYDPLITQYKHFTDFNSECFDQSTGQQIPCYCGSASTQNTDLRLATDLGRDRVFSDGMGEDPWELPPPSPLAPLIVRSPLSCGTRTDRATMMPLTW